MRGIFGRITLLLVPVSLLLLGSVGLIGAALPSGDWQILLMTAAPRLRVSQTVNPVEAEPVRFRLHDLYYRLDANLTLNPAALSPGPYASFSLPWDWSPDGDWLVTGLLAPSGMWLLLFSGDGRQIRSVIIQDTNPNITMFTGARWSPDGRRLVYATIERVVTLGAITQELHVLDVAGLASPQGAVDPPRLLLSHYLPRGVQMNRGRDRLNEVFAWLPDSEHLLLAVPGSELEAMDPDLFTTGLFRLSVTGTTARQTIPTGLENVVAPVASPDGSQIAFLSSPDGTQLWLYLMQADGSGVRLLDDRPQDAPPAWSSEGREIGYWRTEATQSVFYVVNIATGERSVRYTLPDTMSGARWRPAG